MDRCNKAACYDTGRHPVIPGSLIRVRRGDPRLLGRNIGDCPPGYLGRGPHEEGRYEFGPQLVLRHLKRHVYAQGDALHEGPILM